MRAFRRLLCKRRGGALEISANARIITAKQLLYHDHKRQGVWRGATAQLLVLQAI